MLWHPGRVPQNLRGAVTELRRRGYDASESLLQYLVKEGLVRPFELGRWDEAAMDAAAQELDELGSYTSETLVFQYLYLGVDATDYFRSRHEAWDRVRAEYGDAASPVRPNADCFAMRVHPRRLSRDGFVTFELCADSRRDFEVERERSRCIQGLRLLPATSTRLSHSTIAIMV